MLEYFRKLFKMEVPSMDKRAFYELSMLTDRELQDIGLHRGMISAVARGIDPRTGSSL
jgi:uncharacterized protein YjeT (DUF2065 family)